MQYLIFGLAVLLTVTVIVKAENNQNSTNLEDCFDFSKMISVAGSVERCKTLVENIQKELADFKAGKQSTTNLATQKQEYDGVLDCLRERFNLHPGSDVNEVKNIEDFIEAVGNPERQKDLRKVLKECQLLRETTKDDFEKINMCFLEECSKIC